MGRAGTSAPTDYESRQNRPSKPNLAHLEEVGLKGFREFSGVGDKFRDKYVWIRHPALL